MNGVPGGTISGGGGGSLAVTRIVIHMRVEAPIRQCGKAAGPRSFSRRSTVNRHSHDTRLQLSEAALQGSPDLYTGYPRSVDKVDSVSIVRVANMPRALCEKCTPA